MNRMKNLVLFLTAALVIAGCGKSSYRKSPGGMPYQVISGNDTQSVREGDFVKIHFTQKIKDSVYFSTEGSLPIYLPVGGNGGPQPYDISEIWTKLKVGDSVITTQMMDTFIKRSPDRIPPQFKKGDRIMTYVRILAVFKNDSLRRADEDKMQKEWAVSEVKGIEKYLADKKITAQKTPSGAYVQIITPGTGNLVDSGNYVTVNYTATSWSGKKVDSNTDSAFQHVAPYSFVAGARRMITGFDEAMMFMNKGAKAKVFVPSLLGYAGNPGSPNLKPYENLIFDIELLDVKDKEPAQPAAPAPSRPAGQ